MLRKLVGARNEYLGKAIVCCLDLLGFSNNIIHNWECNKEAGPLGQILELKKLVLESKHRTTVLTSPTTIYDPKVMFVSDTIIIALPIEGVCGYDLNYAMISVINAAVNCWYQSLQFGYTLRGGIDLGDVYWNEADIIGPTYINAYEIESKRCNYSRILFGKTYIEELLALVKDYNIDLGDYCLYDPYTELGINPTRLYDVTPDKKPMNPDEQRHLAKSIQGMIDKCPKSNEYVRSKYKPLLHIVEKHDARKVTKAALERIVSNIS